MIAAFQMTAAEWARVSAVLIAHYPNVSADQAEALRSRLSAFPGPVACEAIAGQRAADGGLWADLDVDAVVRRAAAAFPLMTGLSRTIAEAAERLERVQVARHRELAGACFADCGVPARFGAAWPGDVEQLPATRQRAVREPMLAVHTAAAAGETVLVTGETGRGKTHAAAACVLCACDKGQTARYVVLADYSAAVRRRWRAGRSEAAVEGRLRSAKLVVVDEVLAPDPTAAELLERLVRARHDAQMPTVLVTRGTSVSIECGVGKAVADRISMVVRFTGSSLRGKTAGASK